MHAYLIIAKDEKSLEAEIRKIPALSEFKILEFIVQKIEDARNLNSYINLSIPEKTAVLIKNFQNATEESVNAVLKNIEEPQENLVYVIHSRSENSLLPTLRSRCQIIHAVSTICKGDYSDIEKFINMNLSGKSELLNKNKKREEAIVFSDRLLEYLSAEISDGKKISDFEHTIKAAIVLNKSLKINGNINLAHLRFLTDISN